MLNKNIFYELKHHNGFIEFSFNSSERDFT
jgi:hypothetical protein